MKKRVYIKSTGRNCPYKLNYCPHVKPYRRFKCPYSGEYCEKAKEKGAETLRKYCKGFNVCSESCVFYNKNDFGCCVNFPVDYVKKDGGKA